MYESDKIINPELQTPFDKYIGNELSELINTYSLEEIPKKKIANFASRYQYLEHITSLIWINIEQEYFEQSQDDTITELADKYSILEYEKDPSIKEKLYQKLYEIERNWDEKLKLLWNGTPSYLNLRFEWNDYIINMWVYEKIKGLFTENDELRFWIQWSTKNLLSWAFVYKLVF